MSHFNLAIDLDNDDFVENRGLVLANILRDIAYRISAGEANDQAFIKDENGNTVGSYKFVS